MGLLGRTLASLLPLHTAVVGDAIKPRLAACSSLFLDSSWPVRKPFRPEPALRWLFTRSALSPSSCEGFASPRCRNHTVLSMIVVVVVVVVLWQYGQQTCLIQRPLPLCCHLHFGRHSAVLIRLWFIAGYEAQVVGGSSAPPENARAVRFRSLPAYIKVDASVLQASVVVRP
jgi:hypothetical protein